MPVSRLRQNRRLRGALAGVGVLLVAALVGGVLALQQRQTARAEEREAALTALTSNAAALRTNRRDLAALLALEAHRLAPSPATESALFGTFTASPGVERTIHTDVEVGRWSDGAAAIPGTDLLAVVDSRSALHVVDIDSGESRFLEAMTDEFGGVKLAVAAEGRYVAVIWRPRFPNPDTGEDEYTLVTVWDVVTGERRFDPQRLPYAAGSVAINGDGSLVAVSGGYDNRTQVRSGTTGELVVEIDPLPRPPEADFGVSTVAACVRSAR